MPTKLFKKTPFSLTAVDKIAMDPEKGAANDIGWWGKLYFDADIFPWQQYFYHAPQRDKLVGAGIRVGKSKGAAFFLLHHMHYHPNSLVVNTSISSEQAKIVYHSMLELITRDPYKHWVENVERSPYPMIRLVNGAEAWFRSVGYEAELLRGFEFDVINVDEAAYVQSPMTINTLKGRLLGVNPVTKRPRAGLFWQMTSPKGKGGWLFERWKKGDPRYPGANPDSYLSLRVRTTENPLLDMNTLREIMADYSEKLIRQELEGEFMDSDTTEFAMEWITYGCDETHSEVRGLLERIERWRESRQKRKSLKAGLGLTEDLDFYELEPEPGHQYIASWDLGKKATSKGRNATVCMVWDVTELPWKLVAFRYEEGASYLQAKSWIEEWHVKYSGMGTDCITVIDATGKGDVLNELIEEENRISVEGIVYSSVMKPNLITAGKIALERGMCRYPFIRRMVDQLALYEHTDKDLAQDIVMSFCQAMYRARELTGVTSARPVIASHIFRRGLQQGGRPRDLNRYTERRSAIRGQRTGRTY